jgi:hypothetical protein
MPWDINDPYRHLHATPEDPDAESIYGPRVLDQYTAVEREERARAEQAALRPPVAEEEQSGIYRPPFSQGEDEPLTDYARRLADAATERDRGKLATCLVCRKQFRIDKGCRGPGLCSEGCLSRARNADKHRARDNRRNQR